MVAAGSAATAEPKPTLEQVQAQVEVLEHDAADAAELANDAENRLAQVEDDVSALKKRLATAQKQVGADSEAVDAMARSAYTSGGTDGMLQALLADDPEQFLEQAAALDTVSRIGNADLRRSQAARAALAQVKLELAQKQAKAVTVAKEAADQRAVIAQKLQQQRDLLNRLEEKERARLAAIEAAKKAAAAKAAEQAQARAAAQARSSRSSSSSSSSGGGSSSSSGGGGGGSYSSSRAQTAVSAALAQVGEPYSYSASPPNSWDCSKLTAWAWGQAGASLTAYSYAQYQQTRRVSRDQLQPGDLLFYFGSGAHHVGMYIGNGQMVHAANPRSGVEVTAAWGPWYAERYSGAGRVA